MTMPTDARKQDAVAIGPVDQITALRSRLRAFLLEPHWDRFIIGLIILNAIVLGLETSNTVMASAGGLIHTIDDIIIAIFVVEIALRLFAFGRDFWRDPWSIFDFLVVGIALLPETGNLSVLRALRVIRALRLISSVDSMRRVVNGLVQAIPSMGAVIMLLMLIFYVFSVMGTKLYGDTLPELFGNLGASAYSLLQVMTLEGWSTEIVNPVLEKHPYALAFFLPFIVISSFAILNLFIGIIVESMQREAEVDAYAAKRKAEEYMEDIIAELRVLRAEVQELRATAQGETPPAEPRQPTNR
jgi:voltage-gated sodium channel